MKPLTMGKGRLEAFSDGVIAIIITIMVLEMKVPHGANLTDLQPAIPVLINYVISFVYVGIYWNNHHHTLNVVRSVNGAVLWANLHLLFWLSLVPFVTEWMGEGRFSSHWPITLYGIILLMCAIAYTLLLIALIKHEGENSMLATAIGTDWKGKISIVIYCVAIALSFINSLISFGMYIAVACIWFIPDKRIEKTIVEKEG